MKISTILFLIGTGLLLGSIILVINEVIPAKEFCNSINGNYTFLPALKHNCNGIEINNYVSGLMGRYWDFSPRENFNITLSE